MRRMTDLDDFDPLALHQQDSVDLLNSRHRMDCEQSERSSKYDHLQSEQQMHEFKIEIEERYKLSIANKIYTFPRVVRSVNDIVSSSEDEEERYHDAEMLESIDQYNKEAIKDFVSLKSKEFVKIGKNSKEIKTDYRESCLKSQKARFEENRVIVHHSNRKVKVKLKTGSKKKEQNQESKERLSIKKERSSELKVKKQRNQRLKTEIEPTPASVLETIRNKVRKN